MSHELMRNPGLVRKKTAVMLVFNESDLENPKLLLHRNSNCLSLVSENISEGQNYFEVATSRINQILKTGSSKLRELQRRKSSRLFSIRVTDVHDTLPSTYAWYSKKELQELADRAGLHCGRMSRNERLLNPGMDFQTRVILQQVGILDDFNQEQRGKIPEFLYGRMPITGRYYGPEYEHTQAASKALEKVGIKAYPKPDAPSMTISSQDGDTFSFLGGNQLVVAPYQAQLGFFREMKRSHDIPMANGFVYVAIKDGYLGRTASIEVAYAMALGKRLIFSEEPTRFSPELPTEIISIIEKNQSKYPHLDIDEIQEHLSDALRQQIEEPIVSEKQKDLIFASILDLTGDLVRKFGRRASRQLSA